MWGKDRARHQAGGKRRKLYHAFHAAIPAFAGIHSLIRLRGTRIPCHPRASGDPAGHLRDVVPRRLSSPRKRGSIRHRAGDSLSTCPAKSKQFLSPAQETRRASEMCEAGSPEGRNQCKKQTEKFRRRPSQAIRPASGFAIHDSKFILHTSYFIIHTSSHSPLSYFCPSSFSLRRSFLYLSNFVRRVGRECPRRAIRRRVRSPRERRARLCSYF